MQATEQPQGRDLVADGLLAGAAAGPARQQVGGPAAGLHVVGQALSEHAVHRRAVRGAEVGLAPEVLDEQPCLAHDIVTAMRLGSRRSVPSASQRASRAADP